MLKDIDYNRIESLLNYIKVLEDEVTDSLKIYFEKIPQKGSIDRTNNLIFFPSLSQRLLEDKLFENYIGNTQNNIPVDLYLCLYIQQFDLKQYSNYKDVIGIIRTTSLYASISQIHELLEFISLAQVVNYNIYSWHDFTKNFDGTNWHEINLLANLLPISNAQVDEFIDWISLIVQKQERDGALLGIAKNIYDWIMQSEYAYRDIDGKLCEIAVNNSINRFLTPLLKGLHEKQNGVKYYTSKLENSVEQINAYHILFAIGNISLKTKESTDFYYLLILDKLENNKLILHDFINLCNFFNLYKPELFSKIDAIIESLEDVPTLISIIQLLTNDKDKRIDPAWKTAVNYHLFSKNVKELVNSLNYYLIFIADHNLTEAYDLFKFRLKIMAQLNMLEDAFLHIVEEDIGLFQDKLMSWFNEEDSYLHTGVRYLCSNRNFDASIFEMNERSFKDFNLVDRLYIGYKIVGYVYSMEHLQKLILSLIMSIKEDNKILKESYHYILSEYVIYNYRTTLDLIKNLLIQDNIFPFAKELFNQILGEYENYFNQLNNISVRKEIMPSKEQILLKGFYMRKHMSSIHESSKKSSISDFLKKTDINSNKWALRRHEQPKHEVKNLAQISITSEFPSGEYLNPIYQEFIRRTYQKIRKDEINIY